MAPTFPYGHTHTVSWSSAYTGYLSKTGYFIVHSLDDGATENIELNKNPTVSSSNSIITSTTTQTNSDWAIDASSLTGYNTTVMKFDITHCHQIIHIGSNSSAGTIFDDIHKDGNYQPYLTVYAWKRTA